MLPQCHIVKNRRNGFPPCQRPRMNNQWSVWYCVFALALQIYIIVSSIQRFTRYVSLPWSSQGQPYFELNAYVAFIGAAVVLLPFFVISALMKVGNYANDGHKIGEEEHPIVVYQNLQRQKYCQWVKVAWKHGGPVAPLLHLGAAMCLLLPRLLIEAQIIKHGLTKKGAVWRTDFDFMIPHQDRLVSVRFLATLNVSEIWGQQDSSSNFLIDEPAVPTSEFINYTIALVVFTLRYPAIFWNANKSFGLIFSIYSLFTAFQQLLTYVGFSVLYKIHIIGPKEVLLRFSSLFLRTKLAILCFLAYSSFLILSTTVLYFYGLQKYKEWVDSHVQSQLIRWKQNSRRLWGVAPHFTAFVCLIAMSLSAAPLMYDYIMVYCGSLDGIILATVTGSVIHILLWIMLWLLLTIKHQWKFVSKAVKTDLQLTCFKTNGQTAPLLVIDHGQTYQIRENDSKKAILNVVQKSIQTSVLKVSTEEDEDIYWLKPKPPPFKESDRTSAWCRNQRKSSAVKHKVVFQDGLRDSSTAYKKTRSLKKSPKVNSLFKKQNVKFEGLSDSDDGDYATLRDMTASHDYEASNVLSKRLWPENENDRIKRDYENLEIHPYSPSVEKGDEEKKEFQRPKLKKDATPRSDSLSESSTSPEKGTSESSSGVHSASSFSDKRSSSMENVGLNAHTKPPWKSMSLQRGEAPAITSHRKIINPESVPSGTNAKIIEEGTKLGTFERATNVKMISFTDQPEMPLSIDFITKSPQHYPNLILPTHQRRDSANYSLASSADSEFSVRQS